jgi:hypothetical protein
MMGAERQHLTEAALLKAMSVNMEDEDLNFFAISPCGSIHP